MISDNQAQLETIQSSCVDLHRQVTKEMQPLNENDHKETLRRFQTLAHQVGYLALILQKHLETGER